MKRNAKISENNERSRIGMGKDGLLLDLNCFAKIF